MNGAEVGTQSVTSAKQTDYLSIDGQQPGYILLCVLSTVTSSIRLGELVA